MILFPPANVSVPLDTSANVPDVFPDRERSNRFCVCVVWLAPDTVTVPDCPFIDWDNVILFPPTSMIRLSNVPVVPSVFPKLDIPPEN